MPSITPQEAAAKWASRLTASTPEIQRGVQRVTESPTAAAARKKDKMLQNITRAIQSGKWEQGLQRVTLQDWQTATINKGIARIAQGATAAQPKMQEFMAVLLPFQQTLQQQVGNMPDLTLEDNIARMSAWVRGMANFRR